MKWQNIKYKIVGGITRFMSGRNGMDHLGVVSFVLGTILSIVAQASGAIWLIPVSYALMIYSFFRVFSRNVYKRQRENGWLLGLASRIVGWFKTYIGMFRERKEYKFFRCPGCKHWVRVPRGKGKLKITCTRCRHQFSGKT